MTTPTATIDATVPSIAPSRPTLDELAHLHGTDKRSGLHGYTAHYARHFADRRDDPVKLLEIGVLGGASLRMWRDYFPLASIIGLDINPECKQHAGDRIEIEIGPAQASDVAIWLNATVGPFDIIVDDGSHRWDHTVDAFVNFWRRLKPGGIYAVEDLHTSYWREYRGTGRVSPADFLAGLVPALNRGGDLAFESRPGDLTERSAWDDLVAINFYRSLCLLEKASEPR